MLKKLNQFVIATIIISVLLLISGAVLLVYPEVSLRTIAYIIGTVLIVSGLFFMFELSERLFFMSFLPVGVLQVVLGIVILLYPELFKTFLPILVGIWMIVKATIDCKFAFILKQCKYDYWFFTFLLSVLSIICGIVIILNPTLGSLAITQALGIVIIVYSASAIVDAVIFKKNVNDIVKIIK